MATTLICDGPCQKPIRAHRHDEAKHGATDHCQLCKLGAEGHTVGLLNPAVYCHHCKHEYDAHVAKEREDRAALIAQIEARLAARDADLKAAGFAVLPDDDTPGDDAAEADG